YSSIFTYSTPSPTPEIHTLSLHDALPIYAKQLTWSLISNEIATKNEIKAEHEEVIEKTKQMVREQFAASGLGAQMEDSMDMFVRSEEHTSELQSRENLVCRLLLEKINTLI